MRSFTNAALLIALTVPATPAQAREVRRLQPTSKWVVNYAEETCRLGREFGAGDQKVTVIFEQFVPGDAFTLTLVGDMARPVTEIRPIAATVRFGPQEEELKPQERRLPSAGRGRSSLTVSSEWLLLTRPKKPP